MSKSQVLTQKDLPTIKKLADNFQRCVDNGVIAQLVHDGCSCAFLLENGLVIRVEREVEDECAER